MPPQHLPIPAMPRIRVRNLICANTDDFCKRFFSHMKGVGILAALHIYQLLCFLALVSLSIGFTVVITSLYEYFMGSRFSPPGEAFVSIYLVSVCAEFHIFCQQECIGLLLQDYYQQYKHLLPLGTCLVYFFLYIFCWAELYVQFHSLHQEIPATTQNAKSNFEDMSPIGHSDMLGLSKTDQYHTAFFLLALSYIVYCTMKLIHYDNIVQIKRITNPTSCAHSLVTLTFIVLHFVANLLYSIPMAIVAFSIKRYKYSGPMTFVQLNLVAFLSGMVFAVIETRRPWPVVRAKAPFFFYENNSRAKAIMGQLNIIWILISFYNPSSKIPDGQFNGGDDDVLFFCFAVAFNLLHYIKILVFICLQKEVQILVPGDEELMDAAEIERVLGVGAEEEEINLGVLGFFNEEAQHRDEKSSTDNNCNNNNNNQCPTVDNGNDENSMSLASGRGNAQGVRGVMIAASTVVFLPTHFVMERLEDNADDGTNNNNVITMNPSGTTIIPTSMDHNTPSHKDNGGIATTSMDLKGNDAMDNADKPIPSTLSSDIELGKDCLELELSNDTR